MEVGAERALIGTVPESGMFLLKVKRAVLRVVNQLFKAACSR